MAREECYSLIGRWRSLNDIGLVRDGAQTEAMINEREG